MISLDKLELTRTNPSQPDTLNQGQSYRLWRPKMRSQRS